MKKLFILINAATNDGAAILINKKDNLVSSDGDGRFSLPINLYAGYYKAIAKYGNYSCLNTISVFENSSDKISTVLTANRFIQLYNAGSNFTGKLYSKFTGEGLSGQTISLNLTRLSDGASKIYNVTTDSNGEYQLPINLYAGQYRAYCTYGGTFIFDEAGSGTRITVTD
ncbi:carboxypeptidase-like regulatory domain-containing protein [Methanobrevibacter sp. UBA313]|uniref:carboxypeptidase-like regulatory domain-containing protein n=1 Tax=Methanobrevibacter sp. UBA313 TaxID=1915477 RepID=UPI0039B89396